jgi:sugar/nucleoside kinase (ribokinase family)
VRPLAVIGNLARDRIDGLPPRVGGAPFHCARALRLLGQPARIITKCAEADRPSLVGPLVALGVPVCWRPAPATAAFSLRYRGEERSMALEELGEPWSLAEARGWVREALARGVWLHVAPLTRSDFPAETLAELARGRRISLDGQGLVRVPRVGPLELDGNVDPEMLRHVFILKLAEVEARQLVSLTNHASIAALGVPEVVVTLGSRGSLVFAGGKVERVPARPVVARGDPTGAGDAFAVAYLAARAGGQTPSAAARRATALTAALLSEEGT